MSHRVDNNILSSQKLFQASDNRLSSKNYATECCPCLETLLLPINQIRLNCRSCIAISQRIYKNSAVGRLHSIRVQLKPKGESFDTLKLVFKKVIINRSDFFLKLHLKVRNFKEIDEFH